MSEIRFERRFFDGFRPCGSKKCVRFIWNCVRIRYIRDLLYEFSAHIDNNQSMQHGLYVMWVTFIVPLRFLISYKLCLAVDDILLSVNLRSLMKLVIVVTFVSWWLDELIIVLPWMKAQAYIHWASEIHPASNQGQLQYNARRYMPRPLFLSPPSFQQ